MRAIFFRRRHARHKNPGRHAQLHGGERHGHTVVSARCGNDACRRDFAREQVGEGASRLERTRVLQQFQLEEQAAGFEAEIAAAGFQHGSPAHMRTDDFLHCTNMFSIDHRVRHGGPPLGRWHVTEVLGAMHPIPVVLYLGSWLTVYMNLELALRALSNDRRLQILAWLRDPTRHFPPQVDGDLVRDGVCGLLIARKLRVTQPTASEHLKILLQAGLVRGKRIKQWTFYKRDESRIRKIKRMILAKV